MAYEDFTTCLTETLVNRENYLFNYYYQQEGLQELIDSLQNYLEKSAIYAKKEDIWLLQGPNKPFTSFRRYLFQITRRRFFWNSLPTIE